jgi:hypothetical protein
LLFLKYRTTNLVQELTRDVVGVVVVVVVVVCVNFRMEWDNDEEADGEVVEVEVEVGVVVVVEGETGGERVEVEVEVGGVGTPVVEVVEDAVVVDLAQDTGHLVAGKNQFHWRPLLVMRLHPHPLDTVVVEEVVGGVGVDHDLGIVHAQMLQQKTV